MPLARARRRRLIRVAEKWLEHEGNGAWLECDALGIDHELHYDETFNVSWKEGRP